MMMDTYRSFHLFRPQSLVGRTPSLTETLARSLLPRRGTAVSPYTVVYLSENSYKRNDFGIMHRFGRENW